MLMCELSNPYKRRKIITFAPDGSTASYRNMNLQNIGGPFYKNKGRETYNGNLCAVCLLFEEYDIGVICDKRTFSPDITVEGYLEQLYKNVPSTPQDCIAQLDEICEKNGVITGVQVELAKYIAPNRVAAYAACRQARLDRNEKAHSKWIAERERSRAEAEKRAKEENSLRRAALMGWADSMNNLQFGRVEKALSKQFRYDGNVKTRLQNIFDCLDQQYMPYRSECNVYDRNGNGSRKAYYLLKAPDSRAYKITKIEFDLATHLQSLKEWCITDNDSFQCRRIISFADRRCEFVEVIKIDDTSEETQPYFMIAQGKESPSDHSDDEVKSVLACYGYDDLCDFYESYGGGEHWELIDEMLFESTSLLGATGRYATFDEAADAVSGITGLTHATTKEE